MHGKFRIFQFLLLCCAGGLLVLHCLPVLEKKDQFDFLPLLEGARILQEIGSTSLKEATEDEGSIYSVALSEAPASEVTITLSNGDEELLLDGSTEAVSLRFTFENYDVPQTVSIGARDDFFEEGEHTGVLIINITSRDALFEQALLENITFQITDNDSTPPVGDEEVGADRELADQILKIQINTEKPRLNSSLQPGPASVK